MLQLADLVPIEFLKVIVAVPEILAVTSPESLTVAILFLLFIYCTPSVIELGLTVPVNCTVSPTFGVLLVGLIAKLVIEVITVT
mgnify:FL=1